MASPNSKQTTAAKEKERRGKQEKTTTLADRLEQMASNLEKHAFQMKALHTQWRNYLSLLSFLVVILSIYQMHVISSTCLKDIKSGTHDGTISGLQAIALVLKDSASALLAIIMAALLCMFLRETGKDSSADFSHPFFLTAQSFIIPILGVQYYYAYQIPSTTTNGLSPSCLDVGGIAYDATDLLPSQEEGSSTRSSRKSLPAVLVFHVIVTVSLFFMNKQQQTMRKNEVAVAQLRNELEEATAKAQDKKKE